EGELFPAGTGKRANQSDRQDQQTSGPRPCSTWLPWLFDESNGCRQHRSLPDESEGCEGACLCAAGGGDPRLQGDRMDSLWYIDRHEVERRSVQCREDQVDFLRGHAGFIEHNAQRTIEVGDDSQTTRNRSLQSG